MKKKRGSTMKLFKKALLVLSVLFLLIGLAGCGNSEDKQDDGNMEGMDM